MDDAAVLDPMSHKTSDPLKVWPSLPFLRKSDYACVLLEAIEYNELEWSSAAATYLCEIHFQPKIEDNTKQKK